MTSKLEIEVIEAVVDRVVEDEAKARELKRALHRAGDDEDADETINLEKPEEAEDSDELWDDVPV